MNFSHQFFQEIDAVFVVDDLQEDRHEFFEEGTIFKIGTGNTIDIEVIVSDDILIKFFGNVNIQNSRI
jgi:hypothetical protein